MEKSDKTNVMRILDKMKINYEIKSLDNADNLSGAEVASLLNEDPKQAFKTLVTTGSSKNHYVFLIPVLKELDLKKGAKIVSEKSLEMLKQKELFALTGYVHGGCSPIGMKKLFKTVVDTSALDFEKIYFSAGKVGKQVYIKVSDFKEVIPLCFGDICK